jgi:hypothetical protein
VPLPETIAVKYTEEEAEYLSMRPLVRQTFRSGELVDMILAVTGKDPARIRQILRSGTIVFHSYRYWWPGFEAESEALAQLLAGYPDSDASRAFRSEDCAEVILGSSSLVPSGAEGTVGNGLRIRREDARKRRLLRARTFWDCLMDLAPELSPKYREYSYALRGDIYSTPLNAPQLARLAADATRYAPLALRAQLTHLRAVSHIAFVCPRRSMPS